MDSEALFSAREKLLAVYDPKAYGIWHVRGEGEGPSASDCPSLGYFQGTYEQVVDIALKMPKFFTWGDGGTITYLKVKDATTFDVEEVERETALNKLTKRERDLLGL